MWQNLHRLIGDGQLGGEMGIVVPKKSSSLGKLGAGLVVHPGDSV